MANKGKPFSDSDMAYPRITFHAPGRTFDRLLKESSLSDLKETVRKKLGLGSGSVVQFAQLRNGQLVDLEDEDDFDAFCAVTNEQRHATVQVVLTENSVAEDRSVDAKGSTSPLPPTPASALPGHGRLNANSSTFDPGTAAHRKKVVLKNEDEIEVNLETSMNKTSQTPPPSVAPPSRLASVRPLEDLAEEDGLTQEPEEGELHPSKDDAKDRSRGALHTDTALSEKRRPGRLDLSSTRPLPSLLALARPLRNLDSITYPEGITSPKPELNIGAKEGKFRYDRDFLMQFMSICKDKPDSMPPLDSIGLEPVDPLSLTHGASGRNRQLSGTSVPSRQALIGGGLPGAAPRGQFQSMGSFTTTPSKLHSERFEAPGNRSVFMSGPTMPFRNTPLQMTEDQGVESKPSHRTRSKRGEKSSEASKAAPAAAGPQPPNLEPVAPSQMTENRWDRKSFHNNDPDSPEVVDTNVKALLNKLTMEEFDSISDQIIQWANRSENQKDGRTLIQIIRLVFEKATDEATWSGMYARLCRKMMDQISPKVQDEGIRNSEGNPITGGQLFRKYLLNRCQEDFERGWSAKEVTAPTAATKAAEDRVVKAADERSESGEIAVDSDEYYAAQKARRQGVGLIKFIGELFKRQVLTERTMHECIKKLLGNVQPEEEEIESLCTLLSTIGSLLDTRIARVHLDVYFQRMQELSKNVSPRMQSMLQDVIELRKRNWQARKAVVAPTTIAQVHETAVEEKADKKKEAIQRLSISSSGSRPGRTQDDYPQTDGWSSVSRATARAGDLSQFGRTQPPTTFATSAFAGKNDLKHELTLRTNSGSNMFSALQEVQQESNKAADQPSQRKKRVLQPRTKPAKEALVSALTEEAADAKISEDVKEFFSIRNLDEAEVYFTALPSQHHHRLVNKLVSSAVESKERDAVLVTNLFKRANSKGLCSSDAFEEGLAPTAEIIEDIAIDAPKAWSLFSTMVKGAQSNEDHRTRLASKTADSDKLLGLLSDVIGLRESKWQARNAVVVPTTIAQAP